MRDRKHLLLLFAIMLLGFALRAYNINFPSIGYHNGKENDYLSMAQEMQRSGDYITRRIYFLNGFDDVPQYRTVPQPPLISYQILLSWKALGVNLWGPRLINIIFGVLTILVFYLLGLALFRDKRFALFLALLLAVMPLAVFFSRNLQPESPGLLFMALGNLFYLRFISTSKKRDIFFGSLSFTIAWLYKFSFLMAAAPILFCLPYRALFKEKKFKLLAYAVILILPYLILPFTVQWLKSIGQWEFAEISRVKLFEIFTPSYWQRCGRMIWMYMKGDNFGLVFLALAALGMVASFWRRKGLLNRFIIGWTLLLIPYGMIFSDYINQHNYYQMPFLILVCVCVAYAVKLISEAVSVKNVSKKMMAPLIMMVVMGVSAPSTYDSIMRMHATVFLGVDVAGESLSEFTRPGDRVFLLTHAQGYSISRYAKRYVGWENDLELFKEREKKFDIRYICFYPADYALSLKTTNPKLFEYIRDNYRVKEVGAVEEPRQLFYLILERGKNPDPEKFLDSFSGQMRLRTIYKVSGKYIFFYSIRPPIEAKSPALPGDKAGVEGKAA
jgi:4-amino-4-deoxy-L-arabinose transferase-like glycosyltransferase